MNHLTEMYEKSTSFKQYAEGYFDYLKSLMGKIDLSELDRFVSCIEKAREENRRIFFIGNGGSAATASHFVNDLAIGTRLGSESFMAISLTDNNAVMTAVGNDFGYEDLFLKQLEPLMQKSDVLVAISASGNSPNIVKAVKYAKSLDGEIVGITGFDGGQLRELADVKVHVPSSKGEYGPTEDFHMIFDHLICSYLNLKLAKIEN